MKLKKVIKKIVAGLMVATMVVTLVPEVGNAKEAYAQELVTENGIKYNINDDDTLTITGYSGDETKITITDKIDGKSVTSIGASAFDGCSGLKDIYYTGS